MNKTWFGACAAVSIILSGLSEMPRAKADEPSAIGYWVTPEGGSVVQITPCDSGLCGAIVGLRLTRNPGDNPLDIHNLDASKRNQPICGLVMAGSLKPAKGSTTKWEDGWVYDPEGGSTYTAEMKLDGPDTLKLRGFVGISLFGRTMTWTREPATGVKNRCMPAKAG
jgi:uncharacterized protein (DUF2147 family)